MKRDAGWMPEPDDGLVFQLHSRDPFAAPPEYRDPTRRFRGRLPAPVTVWTTTHTGGAAGLTVSSLVVAEGEPAFVLGLVGPLTDFWDALQESERFVVHVLGRDQRRLADQFAGRYPASPFEGLTVEPTAWGPALESAPTRAFCRLDSFTEVGYSVLVQGAIEELRVDETAAAPLIHYRGQYLAARPPGE